MRTETLTASAAAGVNLGRTAAAILTMMQVIINNNDHAKRHNWQPVSCSQLPCELFITHSTTIHSNVILFTGSTWNGWQLFN